MIPSIDLMLGTLERALSVAVVPATHNPAATEEAALGVLFTRWLRDVADQAIDAERASYRECREALADILSILSPSAPGSALYALSRRIEALLARPTPERAAEVRSQTREVKALLGQALLVARRERVEALIAIRRRLWALAGRELDRAIAFGKVTGIDPDGANGPSLAEVLNG